MEKIIKHGLFELKNLFCRKNLMVAGIILILCSISIQQGISDYDAIKKSNREFMKLDKMWVQPMNNYATYSNIGVNVAFAPSPSMILNANPTVMDEIKGRINSIIAVDIYTNTKGKLFVVQNSPFRVVLPNVILFFAVLAALFFGFDATRKKEYVRFLSSYSSPITTFFTMVFARITMIFFWLLMVFGIAFVQVVLAGIPLDSFDSPTLVSHLASALVMLIIFFLLGTAVGMFHSTGAAVAAIFVTWIIFVLFAPIFFNSIVDKKNMVIQSATALDILKFKIVENFEKNIIKKYGPFRDLPIEMKRKVIEGYWNNEFKQLEKLEEQYKKAITALIDAHDSLYILTPTTFYTLTVYEASSRGYSNYLEFYSFEQRLAHDFLRFWLDRVYYNDPKILKSFVTKDENIFKARSHVPRKFAAGMWIQLFYILLLLPLSYFSLKHSIQRIYKAQCTELGHTTIDFSKDEPLICQVENDSFKNFLYLLLCGKTRLLKKQGMVGQVYFNTTDLMKEQNTHDFLYLPHPDDIPGELKVQNLLELTIPHSIFSKAQVDTFIKNQQLERVVGKCFSKLTKIEKFNVLLALTHAVKKEIYLINDIVPANSCQCHFAFKDRLEVLKKEALVIYLHRHFIDNDISKYDDKVYTLDNGNWAIFVEMAKNRFNHRS